MSQENENDFVSSITMYVLEWFVQFSKLYTTECGLLLTFFNRETAEMDISPIICLFLIVSEIIIATLPVILVVAMLSQCKLKCKRWIFFQFLLQFAKLYTEECGLLMRIFTRELQDYKNTHLICSVIKSVEIAILIISVALIIYIINYTRKTLSRMINKSSKTSGINSTNDNLCCGYFLKIFNPYSEKKENCSEEICWLVFFLIMLPTIYSVFIFLKYFIKRRQQQEPFETETFVPLANSENESYMKKMVKFAAMRTKVLDQRVSIV